MLRYSGRSFEKLPRSTIFYPPLAADLRRFRHAEGISQQNLASEAAATERIRINSNPAGSYVGRLPVVWDGYPAAFLEGGDHRGVLDEVAAELVDGVPNARVECGGDDHEATGAVEAILDHGGGEHVLAPELLQWGAAQLGMIGVSEQAAGDGEFVVSGPEMRGSFVHRLGSLQNTANPLAIEGPFDAGLQNIQ